MKTNLCILMCIMSLSVLPLLANDRSDPCGCDAVLLTARIGTSTDRNYRQAALSLVTKESFENLRKNAGANVVIEGIPLGANWDDAQKRIKNELSKYESTLDIREAQSFVFNGVPQWAISAWQDCKASCSKKGLFVWLGYQSKDFVVVVVKWLPHVTPGGKVMEGKFNWDVTGGFFDDSRRTNRGTIKLIGDDEFRLRFVRRNPTTEEFSLQWSGGGVESRSGSISLPNFSLPSKPPTEKIQKFTALLTKLQGFNEKQRADAKQTASDCVSVCDEIFDSLRADFQSRLQDTIEIDGRRDSISSQMSKVIGKMRERIAHFDQDGSTVREAKRDFGGWAGNAKKIMNEFQ